MNRSANKYQSGVQHVGCMRYKSSGTKPRCMVYSLAVEGIVLEGTLSLLVMRESAGHESIRRQGEIYYSESDTSWPVPRMRSAK